MAQRNGLNGTQASTNTLTQAANDSTTQAAIEAQDKVKAALIEAQDKVKAATSTGTGYSARELNAAKFSLQCLKALYTVTLCKLETIGDVKTLTVSKVKFDVNVPMNANHIPASVNYRVYEHNTLTGKTRVYRTYQAGRGTFITASKQAAIFGDSTDETLEGFLFRTVRDAGRSLSHTAKMIEKQAATQDKVTGYDERTFAPIVSFMSVFTRDVVKNQAAKSGTTLTDEEITARAQAQAAKYANEENDMGEDE